MKFSHWRKEPIIQWVSHSVTQLVGLCESGYTSSYFHFSSTFLAISPNISIAEASCVCIGGFEVHQTVLLPADLLNTRSIPSLKVLINWKAIRWLPWSLSGWHVRDVSVSEQSFTRDHSNYLRLTLTELPPWFNIQHQTSLHLTNEPNSRVWRLNGWHVTMTMAKYLSILHVTTDQAFRMQISQKPANELRAKHDPSKCILKSI